MRRQEAKKLVWSEGLFVTQHHFQSLDAYHEGLVADVAFKDGGVCGDDGCVVRPLYEDQVRKTPLITTGAGDHFNCGFVTGQLLGLEPEACLTLGVCTSGHYVRTGESPTLATLETFLANWR